MAINRLQENQFEEISTGTIIPSWKLYDLRKESLKIIKRNKDEVVVESTTRVVLEEYRAYYKNILIDSLNSDRYFLIKPISVTIEHCDNVYVATNYDLDIYGYGDSEVEALDELKSLIVEFYEDLKEEKDLAPIPRKMMYFYKEVLKEK